MALNENLWDKAFQERVGAVVSLFKSEFIKLGPDGPPLPPWPWPWGRGPQAAATGPSGSPGAPVSWIPKERWDPPQVPGRPEAPGRVQLPPCIPAPSASSPQTFPRQKCPPRVHLPRGPRSWEGSSRFLEDPMEVPHLQELLLTLLPILHDFARH